MADLKGGVLDEFDLIVFGTTPRQLRQMVVGLIADIKGSCVRNRHSYRLWRVLLDSSLSLFQFWLLGGS